MILNERQLSQRQKVLGHLLTGKSITPLEALQKFGCYRLSSVIHRLRKRGYEIKTFKMSIILDRKHAKENINYAKYKMINQ